MTRPRLRHLPALAGVLFIASCAPKRSDVTPDISKTSASALLVSMDERGKRIRSMTGKGTIEFESPEMSGSAWFQSAMKKPDSLLVTVEGPFGIDVGTFFLSREKYVVYNSLQNSVVTGSPSSGAITSLIPFSLSFEQLLNTFSGVLTLPAGTGDLNKYSATEDAYFLSFSCGANTCSYWIDAEYLLVKRYEMRNPQGELVMEATASWFVEQDDLAAAKRIVVGLPRENRQLAISYNSLTLNAPHPRFEFTIPANAERIER